MTINRLRPAPPFKDPLFESIICDRKTQTRRVMDPQPLHLTGSGKRVYADADFRKSWGRDGYGQGWSDCRYGEPGDRWYLRERLQGEMRDGKCVAVYRRDGAVAQVNGFPLWWRWQRTWLPSIHMPREAARYFVELTDVRVRRLNEISQDDCRAEGCDGRSNSMNDPLSEFVALWESINGVGSWDANPWCWCLTFKRVAA